MQERSATTQFELDNTLSTQDTIVIQSTQAVRTLIKHHGHMTRHLFFVGVCIFISAIQLWFYLGYLRQLGILNSWLLWWFLPILIASVGSSSIICHQSIGVGRLMEIGPLSLANNLIKSLWMLNHIHNPDENASRKESQNQLQLLNILYYGFGKALLYANILIALIIGWLVRDPKNLTLALNSTTYNLVIAFYISLMAGVITYFFYNRHLINEDLKKYFD